MTKLLVLGATGSLGSYIARLAVNAGHQTTVLIRDESRLPAGIRDQVTIKQADITALPPHELAAMAGECDVLLNAASTVSAGRLFVELVDHVASSVELVPEAKRPICWFLAGLGLLDLGRSGRRGIDLPILGKRFWAHRENYNRLLATTFDWRLLCPGPMVHDAPIGPSRLRASVDQVPVKLPAWFDRLPGPLLLPLLLRRMSEFIVPFEDAAAFMLANIDRESVYSRRRAGIALPAGMKAKKADWLPNAQPNATS